MPQDRPAFDWKTPQQESAMKQPAETSVLEDEQPKDRKPWVWRDGGWNEANSKPKASDENE